MILNSFFSGRRPGWMTYSGHECSERRDFGGAMEKDDKPVPRFSEQDYRDQADFRRAIRTFLSYSEVNSRAAGITPRQYLALLLIRGSPSYPSMSITELAEGLKLTQPTVSSLVDRLVQAALLTRHDDPSDRRRSVLTLTTRGQRALDDVMAENRRQMGVLEGEIFSDSLRKALRAVKDRAE